MASEQELANEAITKAVEEVTRAAIHAMAATTAEVTKCGRPQKRETCHETATFNWEADDKYSELKTFKLEVNNILKMYNTPQTEQLAMVKIWLGRKDLQFLESLTSIGKDACSTLEGLFKILTNKFRPQFNEMIKSLQFCKLSRL